MITTYVEASRPFDKRGWLFIYNRAKLAWPGPGSWRCNSSEPGEPSRTLILQDQTPPVASSSCCILYFANLPHSWSYFSQNHLRILNSVCLEPHTCAPWATEIWWLIWLLRFNEIESGEGFTFDYYDPPDTNFHAPLVKAESGGLLQCPQASGCMPPLTLMVIQELCTYYFVDSRTTSWVCRDIFVL